MGLGQTRLYQLNVARVDNGSCVGHYGTTRSGFNPSDEDEDDDGMGAGGRETRGRAEGAAAVDESFEALKAKFEAAVAATTIQILQMLQTQTRTPTQTTTATEALVLARGAHLPRTGTSMRAAIAELGGVVVPKLTWSTPKDVVWMSTTNNMRCINPER